MTTTTHATPDPDDFTTADLVQREAPATAATAQPAPSAQPAWPAQPAAARPVTRSLSTGAIVGIALGGVALAALLFGGGVAVGTVLPTGAPGGSSQTGFPGENRGPGGLGTRPDMPRGDTNPPGPSAPNSDETETDGDSDAGS